MRSSGCEHVAAPPMVLHSPQFGECRLAVLGRSRSVGRVGEGTGFWLLGWVTAALAPVADDVRRPELWMGRRFLFYCRRCPGSFSPIAFPLAGRFRVGGFLNFSFQLSTFLQSVLRSLPRALSPRLAYHPFPTSLTIHSVDRPRAGFDHGR